MRKPRARGAVGLAAEVLLVLLVIGLGVAPRLIGGRSALEWTRHHAARGAVERQPGADLRGAGRWAARTIELLAPLPPAGEAARLALALGDSAGARDPQATLALCVEVRGAIDRVGATAWRDLTLRDERETARRCESEARLLAPGGRR
jgi:hypothetical protein